MTKRIKSYWRREFNDIIRGASGGFLFGIPLLYTMEVWRVGSQVDSSLMLLILVITYITVFGLNYIEGFRRHKRNSLMDVVLESIEALAIGFICSTIILILLQRIRITTPLEEILGKAIFETVPFAIGTALARLLLNGTPTKSASNNNSSSQDSRQSTNDNYPPISNTWADISASLMGAIIIAFSIAPTDEVRELAAATSPPWLLAIMIASLLISYMIVFAAGFPNQQQRQQQKGMFQTPHSETIFSYLIALIASALMLWFFQQLNFNTPWFVWLQYTIILGLPAAIGGAAGRIAV